MSYSVAIHWLFIVRASNNTQLHKKTNQGRGQQKERKERRKKRRREEKRQMRLHPRAVALAVAVHVTPTGTNNPTTQLEQPCPLDVSLYWHPCSEIALTVQYRNLMCTDDRSHRNAEIIPLRLLRFFLGAASFAERTTWHSSFTMQ